ncbi:hypothetical protein Ancab_040047 [Ancistrocladus abbreviatus]
MKFPVLCSLTASPFSLVADAGFWIEGRWCWNLQWTRPLSTEESAVEQALMAMLNKHKLTLFSADKWNWGNNSKGIYTVWNVFTCLCPATSTACSLVLPSKLIWRKELLKKVSCFMWRWTLDKLPTRANLFRRHILHEDSQVNCVFCNDHVEDLAHVMIGCSWSWEMWCRVFRWWGVQVILPFSIEDVAKQVVIGMGNFVGGAAWRLVCFALFVSIWRARNLAVFDKKLPASGLSFDRCSCSLFVD